jgi:hypothetical protein
MFVDEWIGRIMNAREANGYGEDTYILFTSGGLSHTLSLCPSLCHYLSLCVCVRTHIGCYAWIVFVDEWIGCIVNALEAMAKTHTFFFTSGGLSVVCLFMCLSLFLMLVSLSVHSRPL